MKKKKALSIMQQIKLSCNLNQCNRCPFAKYCNLIFFKENILPSQWEVDEAGKGNLTEKEAVNLLGRIKEECGLDGFNGDCSGCKFLPWCSEYFVDFPYDWDLPMYDNVKKLKEELEQAKKLNEELFNRIEELNKALINVYLNLEEGSDGI